MLHVLPSSSFLSDSSNSKVSNQERYPLMPVASVPGGHEGHPGVCGLPAARVDDDIIRHQGAHLPGGDGGVSQSNI